MVHSRCGSFCFAINKPPLLLSVDAFRMPRREFCLLSWVTFAIVPFLARIDVTTAFAPVTWQPSFRTSTTWIGATASKPSKGRVVIVGGGPAGLLLTHGLLRQTDWHVTLIEQRSYKDGEGLSARAYALGIGIRGRTAIQRTVDMKLWQALEKKGFASDRFILHAGPLSIKLRDGQEGVEPSLLMYQSDLCQILFNELESRWSDSGRLTLSMDTAVTSLDVLQRNLVASGRSLPFDVVIGCDGVNSIVRESIGNCYPAFASERKELPGVYKVVQLAEVPPQLDGSAVQLLIPKQGGVTAFIEPGRPQACVLLAGRNESDVVFRSDNATAVAEALESRFPKMEGADFVAMAEQLVQRKIGSASSVSCNTYHLKGMACLVGDAAHATGGVSGQGLNSALKDVEHLVGCLKSESDTAKALLQYSKHAVPEGRALYDLSFGDEAAGAFSKLRSTFMSLVDFVFRGRLGIGGLPLQTKLTTTLDSFADIRKQRDIFFSKGFPEANEWESTLENLDELAPSTEKQKQDL